MVMSAVLGVSGSQEGKCLASRMTNLKQTSGNTPNIRHPNKTFGFVKGFNKTALNKTTLNIAFYDPNTS